MRRVSAILALASCALLAASCSAPEKRPPAVSGPAPAPSAEATRAPGPWPRIELTETWRGLDQPLDVDAVAGRLFVTEKSGRVRELLPGGKVSAEAFLDLSALVSAGSEQGLLGIAFSPRFANDRLLFVDYTDRAGDTVVARYAVAADGSRADPASAVTVLRVDQPYPNHNGGCVAFGPDGMLYVGMGDGGSGGDPEGNAQDRGVLLGKLLRLDVGATGTPLPAGRAYRAPSDNPFASVSGARPEIWAYGLRNPWRFSFDRETGDLWIGDVGQNLWEEIDRAEAGSRGGENYGWDLWEGAHPYPADAERKAPQSNPPVAEYGRDLGSSVTGGVVYRGEAYPALRGVYLYADYVSGRVWGLRPASDGEWETSELLDTGRNIASFGEDAAGEVYLLDLNGSVLRLTAR